jgi:hypothetical protein
MIRTRTVCLAAGLLAGVASGQVQDTKPAVFRAAVVADSHTRIVDPKLAGGGAEALIHVVPKTATLAAKAEIFGAGGALKTVWTGTLVGTAAPTAVTWDGTDASGKFVATGDYSLRVSAQAGGGALLSLPITVVRLGVTELEFRDTTGADNEWQMVYFKKSGVDGVFYATPAIHEYLNTKRVGEVSDLDLNNGAPRPSAVLHTETDQPVMNGTAYDTERYNYPVSYVAGTATRVEVKLGDGGTTVGGVAMPSGYPVAGYDLRLVAGFPIGAPVTTGPVVPGGAYVLDGPPVPADAGRYPFDFTWRFQYAPSGTGAWSDVPGSVATSHRVYTLIDTPKFKAGASGTQYAGPWVEMAENFASWKDSLGTDTTTHSGVVEAFVKGFFGQNGGIAKAIEGVIYDAYPLGGDGGATHYYSFGSTNMDLSALLNAHAKGIYVNCSDCMGGTATGLAMLGIGSLRPVYLGPMTLKAIWGIGAPAYTTALWGGAHSFSYHHVVTRTDGLSIIDCCMQLDEDGTPGSVPGIPGWNVDRLWAGVGGYNDLSSYNDVTKTLQALPGLL